MINETNPFMEIEREVTALMKSRLELNNKIKELKNNHEALLDSIFTDLLSVIDSLEKADLKAEEQYPTDESVLRTRRRFATAKRKLLSTLEKYNVSKIEFPDGIATDENSEIVATEPDLEKLPNQIVSIEKDGYRRNGRLLRLAEVIVVKN